MAQLAARAVAQLVVFCGIDFLEYEGIGIAVRQPHPVGQVAALPESAGAEEPQAGRVAHGNMHIELVQMQESEGILHEGFERIAAQPLAGAGRVDEQSDGGPPVGGVVVEAVDESHSLEAVAPYNHQSQLVVAGDVGRVILNIAFEQVARQRRYGAAMLPQRGIVFPAVEDVEVFGFESP